MTGGALPGLRVGQLTALDAPLNGSSMTQAAAAAGCNRRTLYEWSRQPEFQVAFDMMRQAVLSGCRNRLACLADMATDSLADCSEPFYPHARGEDDKRILTTQSVRLAAAREILDRLGVKATKAAEDEPTSRRSPADLEAALRARGWRHVDDPPDDGPN